MPLIYHSTYRPPTWAGNRHFQTIYPNRFRKFHVTELERQRLTTKDGDFLDLDWLRVTGQNGQKNNKLAIIAHGLEGNSRRPYTMGMAYAMRSAGLDALNWNFRGCSGEMNLRPRTYHAGLTEDLKFIISKLPKHYTQIAVIGFSLGGNLVLKYLGENGSKLPKKVKAGVAFSVPCDLKGSALHIGSGRNKLYEKYFLMSLKEKMHYKQANHIGEVPDVSSDRITSIATFDDLFQAPLNGFKDADDYWQQSSSMHFVHKIKVPTLLVSATDDPMLTDSCFPIDQARTSKKFFLEMPNRGGHTGFWFPHKSGFVWSELRAAQFITEHMLQK